MPWNETGNPKRRGRLLRLVAGCLTVALAGSGPPEEAVEIFSSPSPAAMVLELPGESWESLRRDPFLFARGSVVYVFPGRDGLRLEGVGIRFKGNSTFFGNREKRSFKVSTDYFREGQTLLGAKTLNLHHPFKDPSSIREVLAYELFRKAGVPAPRATHVKLYLEVPGVHERAYQGVYTLTEQVGKRFLKRYFDDSQGVLFKIEGIGDPFAVRDSSLRRRGLDRARDPYPGFRNKLGKARRTELARLLRAVREGQAREAERLFDVDRFVAWLAANAIMANWDSYAGTGHNAYVYGQSNGRFTLIPWDTNEAFGVFSFGIPQRELEEQSIFRPFVGSKALIDWILADPARRRQYVEKARELLRGPCSPERVAALILSFHERIAAAVRADPAPEHPIARFEESVDPEGPGLAGFASRRLGRIGKELESAAVEDFLAKEYRSAEDRRGRELRPPGRSRRPPSAWWRGRAVAATERNLVVFDEGVLLRLDPETLAVKARLDVRPLGPESSGGRAEDPRPERSAPPPFRPPDRGEVGGPRSLREDARPFLEIVSRRVVLLAHRVLVTVPLQESGDFGKPNAVLLGPTR